MAVGSRLISVVPEIEALRFVKARTSRVYRDAKVVWCKKNQYKDLFLVRFADGTLYNWMLSPHGSSFGCYLPSERHIPILQLCVQVGAISQDNLDAHIAAYRQSWDAEAALRDLHKLELMLKIYNVKVPSKLLAVLRKKSTPERKVARR